jgi:hypothetical protein
MSENRTVSIEIINRSNGCYNVNDIIAEELKIYRKGEIYHNQYNGLSDQPVASQEYKVGSSDIDPFFKALESK